jgi:two-component system, OmpR family, phosphate regulon sensor histidine kinase PhoR
MRERGGPGPVGAGGGVEFPPASTMGDDDRALLEAVFETSGAGLAVIAGEDLHYLRANDAYRALTPAPEVDPTGRCLADVWPLEPGVTEALRGALARGEPLHREELPVTFGRATRWFSFHARPVQQRGGPALLVVVTETTAFVLSRQSAEAALDHALRRAAELDAVIDAIADGFVLYGASGEVLRFNAAAARLVEAGELEPRVALASPGMWLEFSSLDGRPLGPEDVPVTRALAGETVVGAHLHVSPDAGDKWLLVSAAPVRGADGRVAGAVVTFSDETAIHELEEARDDLVRMISHDLRTPLNAVYTQAHLLRRAPADAAKVAERARSIARSCERMSGMIHDLVETALLESGQLELSPVPVDLAVLLPELVERLRGGLDVDRLEISLAAGLPRVYADPARLERIVTNLLSNALKYSPGQAKVTLTATAAGTGVEMTVADRGVGIAPEDQAHVFDRFFRARSARRPEGLGLGLYITRLLVEAHHGKVEVESALGQGSTFRVFLPAAAEVPAAPSVAR